VATAALRFLYRVTLSNHRLLDIDGNQVRLRWKDYRDHRQKTLTLSAGEFIRRFLLHVLPTRFQRIRYYGLLGNRHREQNLARCRQLLDMPPPEPPVPQDYRDRLEQLTGVSLRRCPACHQGRMLVVDVLPATGRRPAHRVSVISTPASRAAMGS